MCKYCENYNIPYSELKCEDVVLFNSTYMIIGDGRELSMPVNYCPNCGRKLENAK